MQLWQEKRESKEEESKFRRQRITDETVNRDIIQHGMVLLQLRVTTVAVSSWAAKIKLLKEEVNLTSISFNNGNTRVWYYGGRLHTADTVINTGRGKGAKQRS